MQQPPLYSPMQQPPLDSTMASPMQEQLSTETDIIIPMNKRVTIIIGSQRIVLDNGNIV
jgi:hypothetical protein